MPNAALESRALEGEGDKVGTRPRVVGRRRHPSSIPSPSASFVPLRRSLVVLSAPTRGVRPSAPPVPRGSSGGRWMILASPMGRSIVSVALCCPCGFPAPPCALLLLLTCPEWCCHHMHTRLWQRGAVRMTARHQVPLALRSSAVLCGQALVTCYCFLPTPLPQTSDASHMQKMQKIKDYVENSLQCCTLKA